MMEAESQRHLMKIFLLGWMSINHFSQPVAAQEKITLNQKENGYRGIWYMNQPLDNEYKYKYSGGLGTYCAKHKPFAVYCPEVEKTFFCYGGTSKSSHQQLLHMVSFFDHKTKMVPRPTVLLDKKTDDAHDNPVMSVDQLGHIWIFSTSHGTGRPSLIHRRSRPYDIDSFELVNATRLENGKEVPITNFSYLQVWQQADQGFISFFTKYGWGSGRTICCMTSSDGRKWSEWKQLATIAKGHYQVSGISDSKAGSAFNYHPEKGGLNYRTNLYFIETPDFGQSWQTASGRKIELPLNQINNAALVYDYESEGLKVYLKDIRYDSKGYPVILYVTSRGYQSGPENDPRTWTTARWTGQQWDINPVTSSDNNYDMGSLYINSDGSWSIIGPTATGPQPYNPGGEMVFWRSTNQGTNWEQVKQITSGSAYNHTYARAPVNAHPDFFSFWADGHGRQPSDSRLYFSNQAGQVYQLPRQMTAEYANPQVVLGK